jgi:hypothetical protein
MRILILYRRKKNKNILLISFFVIGILLSNTFTADAQWVNNPAVNTLLISAVNNPVNITSTEDLKGGAFIFWEDNRPDSLNEIYFLHFDGNGKVSFRVDGKKVSGKDDVKTNPLAVSSLPNSAVVVWKSLSGIDKGNLFAQRVNDKGQLLWLRDGVKITNTSDEILHYSIDSDRLGNTFLVYMEKIDKNYNLHLQKIDQNGKLIFDTDSKPLSASGKTKSLAAVVADNEGGAYVLFLETEDNKSTVYGYHVDEAGNSTWENSPLALSGSPSNIISYSVKPANKETLYLAWQIYREEKDIYHQLIDKSGKSLWKTGGKLATALRGSQVNPQVLPVDSTIILSWTQETENDRDIFIQKYNFKGDPIWNKDGLPVIQLGQDQFGQKLVTDGKGGAIVSWIDRRDESRYEHLFSQRVNKDGKLVWDSLAIPVASHPGSVKSYLSIISDGRGGIIAVFKDKREEKTGIYGQKVFNTGTYISQIVGFQADIEGDSVKISWYSANETGPTTYEIERTTGTDTVNSSWEVVNSVLSDGSANAKLFELKDKPVESGTVYYRLVQTDEKGNIQTSDISNVNYFFGAAGLSLAQNFPNPFDRSTIIKFYLPVEMDITFEFFDSHIDKIDEIKQRFPAGENEVQFDASTLPQGVYFYRFEAGDFVDVKKMVVVK